MRIDRKAIAAAVVLAFLSTSCVLTGSALSGFTASVKNTGSTAGSGTDFLTATNSGTTQCTSVPGGVTVPATASFPCTGNQFPGTVATTGNTTGAETLTASGTSRFTSATYSAPTCAPVQLANTAMVSDPMVVRGGVTFAGGGPTTLSGSGSFGVDGSTGMAADVTSVAGPQNFSVGIWFKSSTATGGMMGFSTSPSDAAASMYDRHLYFNPAGDVVFGVYPGAPDTIQSPSSYANGGWHFALGTVASGLAGGTSTQTLYVDGSRVATTTRVVSGGNGAQVYNGYWRIGDTRTTVADSWTGNGEYFTGALSNAMVFPTALSAAQVTALYASTTQAALASLVSADGAGSFWPLNDNGLQTFAGPFPVLNTTSPCSQIRATVGTASKCVFPASASACPAQSSTNLLSGLVSAGTLSLAPSVVGTPQTLTTTLSEDTSYNTGYDVGLHLLVPITITESPFAQTFTWSSNVVIV